MSIKIEDTNIHIDEFGRTYATYKKMMKNSDECTAFPDLEEVLVATMKKIMHLRGRIEQLEANKNDVCS